MDTLGNSGSAEAIVVTAVSVCAVPIVLFYPCGSFYRALVTDRQAGACMMAVADIRSLLHDSIMAGASVQPLLPSAGSDLDVLRHIFKRCMRSAQRQYCPP
jgi:hypothetical protein